MREIHTTCKDKKEAEKIAKILLTKKIAACVNYFPVNSMYLWEGKIEKSSEYLLLIKTSSKNKKKAIETISSNHSYELPVISSATIKSTKAAEEWINNSVC